MKKKNKRLITILIIFLLVLLGVFAYARFGADSNEKTEDTVTATPTATATNTPTPTPTVNPTATPKPTAKPTATPTPNGLYLGKYPCAYNHNYYRNETAAQIAEAEAAVKAMVDEILSHPELDTASKKVRYAEGLIKKKCVLATYEQDANHYYSSPYGLLIKGVFTCAGSARTLGRICDYLGIQYAHVNENQYTHQYIYILCECGCGFSADGYWTIYNYLGTNNDRETKLYLMEKYGTYYKWKLTYEQQLFECFREIDLLHSVEAITSNPRDHSYCVGPNRDWDWFNEPGFWEHIQETGQTIPDGYYPKTYWTILNESWGGSFYTYFMGS